jgi:hypothetical protein
MNGQGFSLLVEYRCEAIFPLTSTESRLKVRPTKPSEDIKKGFTLFLGRTEQADVKKSLVAHGFVQRFDPDNSIGLSLGYKSKIIKRDSCSKRHNFQATCLHVEHL